MTLLTVRSKLLLGCAAFAALSACGATAPDSLVNLPDKGELVDASQTSDEEFRAALANYEAGKDRENALKAVEYRNGEPVWYGETKMQFNPIAEQVVIDWNHSLPGSDTVSSAKTIYPTDQHGVITEQVDPKTGKSVPLAPLMRAAFQGKTMESLHVKGMWGVLSTASYGLAPALVDDGDSGAGAVAIANGIAQQSQQSSTKTKVESTSGSGSGCEQPCGM